MRIRIIANNPPENDLLNYSDITKHIGNEYEVTEDYFFEDDTVKGVYIKELDKEIYDGEFEIVS